MQKELIPIPNHACGPDFLGPLLGYATHLARERMDARLSRNDMTPSQTHASVSQQIIGTPPPSGMWWSTCGLGPPLPTVFWTVMEEKSLIRRTADENDQRQKQVTATEKGRELNSLRAGRLSGGGSGLCSRGCGRRRPRLCGCFCTVSSRI